MKEPPIRWFSFGLIVPLMIIPIYMNFTRVGSPEVDFEQNLEFFTRSGMLSVHRDTYTVVLTYCNNVKPEDTIETVFMHFPTNDDIVWFDFYHELPAFYAPDNNEKKRYLYVCNVRVIHGKIAPFSVEAQKSLMSLIEKQNKGLVEPINTNPKW